MSLISAICPPVSVHVFLQDGCDGVRAAAGPGEEQDAAQRSGHEGPGVQNQLPCSLLHPEERRRPRRLHRVTVDVT